MGVGFRKTHEAVGTSLQGYVWATFDQLVERLGPPHYGEELDPAKSTAHWHCKTDAGVVFTVYDYDGDKHSTDGGVYQWHLGGRNVAALAAFELLTGLIVQRIIRSGPRPNIVRGQRIWWKPEWHEASDEGFTFIALEDSADERGEMPTIDIGVTQHYHWFMLPRQRVAVDRITAERPTVGAHA